MTDFSPKYVGETEVFTFDYVHNLAVGEAIQSALITVQVLDGTDANPVSMVLGGASINGTQVMQRLQGGVAGVYYRIICTATTTGSQNQVLMLDQNLKVNA
jgi:hypothetical protein